MMGLGRSKKRKNAEIIAEGSTELTPSGNGPEADENLDTGDGGDRPSPAGPAVPISELSRGDESPPELRPDSKAGMLATVVKLPKNSRLVIVKPLDGKFRNGRMVLPRGRLKKKLAVLGRRLRVRFVEEGLYEFVR